MITYGPFYQFQGDIITQIKQKKLNFPSRHPWRMTVESRINISFMYFLRRPNLKCHRLDIQ